MKGPAWMDHGVTMYDAYNGLYGFIQYMKYFVIYMVLPKSFQIRRTMYPIFNNSVRQ